MFETLLTRGEHVAQVQAQRALLRFLNGVDWLIRDPKQVVGRTPYEVVYQRGKLEVRRYHHAHADVPSRYDLPVLLVPPLMVKPFIFDLFPGRSLVKYLPAAVFTCSQAVGIQASPTPPTAMSRSTTTCSTGFPPPASR